MTSSITRTWSVLAITLIVVALIAGCGGKKKAGPEFWMYTMPEGEALQYEKAEKVTQAMEVMGQSMDMKFSKDITFTMRPVVQEEKTIQVEITIDAMEADMSSPQGDFSADTEPIIGESFGILISRLGKELDVSETEEIKYSQGAQGERSVKADFSAFLPDLPGRPVLIGDTWTTRDTIAVSEGNTDLVIHTESVNTLQAFETKDGTETVMVTAKINGTVTGEGEQMGAPLTFDGTTVGDETWYFAHEEGTFLMSTASMVTTATVEVKGPQTMTIPITMNMTSETKLVE
jgi:hypothetical protein